MNSIRKVVNNIKFPKSMNISLNIEGSGLLHNKAVLYLIFIISFGNFMMELIVGDYYFVSIYILIGFLTTFFNKNMIVVLAMAAIFANILKYGAKSVEGMEGDVNLDNIDNTEPGFDIGDSIAVDIPSKNGEDTKETIDTKPIKETKETKPITKPITVQKSGFKTKSEDSDSDDSDSDDSESESDSRKKKYKKKGEPFKDRLEMSDYEESEKLLKNQKLLLKNMKEIKPFFDTIQGLTSSFTGNKVADKASK